mmetsp:Transcript_153/g.301  ORF Transcript_153/g.301 Transcript_153/m.301 type:complete len:207 (+) Transcript_153:165-785(+)
MARLGLGPSLTATSAWTTSSSVRAAAVTPWAAWRPCWTGSCPRWATPGRTSPTAASRTTCLAASPSCPHSRRARTASRSSRQAYPARPSLLRSTARCVDCSPFRSVSGTSMSPSRSSAWPPSSLASTPAPSLATPPPAARATWAPRPWCGRSPPARWSAPPVSLRPPPRPRAPSPVPGAAAAVRALAPPRASRSCCPSSRRSWRPG